MVDRLALKREMATAGVAICDETLKVQLATCDQGMSDGVDGKGDAVLDAHLAH